jgi:predicted homoserine dehydrogenase-like protein
VDERGEADAAGRRRSPFKEIEPWVGPSLLWEGIALLMPLDRMLAEREHEGKPIHVALVGAGYSGRNIAHQIIKSVPGLRLAAISNRTLSRAREAYALAGVSDVHLVESAGTLEDSIRRRRFSITDDPSIVCAAEGIDAVIESTGTIDFAAHVVLRAVENKKHVVLMNVELDSTLGPLLKVRADRAGIVYTNSDGDEPGAAMNLVRFVRSIGLKPVVAGNLKGLYDPYRTPETQREFAERNNQQAAKIASFADGTKLSMELAVLANATGFGVAKRGMYGPSLTHVDESGRFFLDKLIDNGMVDFLVGAKPSSGVFVLGYSEDPVKAAYLRYLKMGEGPLYVFYRPFHLPQWEAPLSVARAVLFHDATVAPVGEPKCDAVAIAKRDLQVGETLDGLGGFMCYGLLEDYRKGRSERALPIGLSEGCRVIKQIAKDQLVTYGDIELPKGRLGDRLREEQNEVFNA